MVLEKDDSVERGDTHACKRASSSMAEEGQDIQFQNIISSKIFKEKSIQNASVYIEVESNNRFRVTK